MSPPAAIPTLRSRLAGAVWGHLVGDAAGVPYEFRSSEQIGDFVFGASGTHGQPPGTWSDDGALMLALLDSLLSAGFDPADQGRRIVAWHRDGAYAPGGLVFDVGNTTQAAIRNLEAGLDPLEAGPDDERSAGNGSLMRILPIALVGRDLPPEILIGQARAASRLTHGHPVAQMACALYCLAARELLAGAAPGVALTVAALGLRETLRGLADQTALAALDRLWRYRGRTGGGVVWDSFGSAYDVFASSSSYGQTIEAAIALGNDTDTTAAIAGGLAGVRFGLNAIPTEWLERMRGGDIAQPLIDRLIAGAG
jgi:ADP-ribosylglycohydrolase